MAKYAIGLDYGTLSGRALVVNVETGEELASSVFEYPHAVMDEKLPCGKKLGQDWALQHPQDYIDALRGTVRAVIADAGIDPHDIVGVGVDFTACTVLPIFEDGTPLCFAESYADNPHAYVKMIRNFASSNDKRNTLSVVSSSASYESCIRSFSSSVNTVS